MNKETRQEIERIAAAQQAILDDPATPDAARADAEQELANAQRALALAEPLTEGEKAWLGEEGDDGDAQITIEKLNAENAAQIVRVANWRAVARNVAQVFQSLLDTLEFDETPLTLARARELIGGDTAREVYDRQAAAAGLLDA